MYLNGSLATEACPGCAVFLAAAAAVLVSVTRRQAVTVRSTLGRPALCIGRVRVAVLDAHVHAH